MGPGVEGEVDGGGGGPGVGGEVDGGGGGKRGGEGAARGGGGGGKGRRTRGATQKINRVEPAILTIHSGNKKNVDGLVKVVALPKLCFRLPASRGASIGELFTIHALFVSGVGGWMQLEWTARMSR